MNAQWRLFLAALHWVTQRVPSTGNAGSAPPQHASRFVPVVGICMGLVAAVAYWAAAQVWPTSIAVVLSLLAVTLMTATGGLLRPGPGALYWVFVPFIKYNALMALSAANVPLPLPEYCALGIIMIAGQAASHCLVVSVMAADSPAASTPPAVAIRPNSESAPLAGAAPTVTGVPHLTPVDLLIALALGLAPAVLLGIPGLIGLVAAIVMRLGLTASVLRRCRLAARERLQMVQQLTEVSFYLGALASWKYV